MFYKIHRNVKSFWINISKHFSTSLNADLIKQIKLLSVERGVALNDLLEDAIREYLKS